jgi:hypothetical protein
MGACLGHFSRLLGSITKNVFGHCVALGEEDELIAAFATHREAVAAVLFLEKR